MSLLSKGIVVSALCGITFSISVPPAQALRAIGKGLPINFSKIVYQSCRAQGGTIWFCLMLDPVPSPGVLAIGTEIKYDSSKVRIIPESSGFLCDFSIGGSCPSSPLPQDFNETIQLGNPRNDTTFNLSVTSDTIIFSQDLSKNPTPATENSSFFFAIAFEPINGQEVSVNDFVQQVSSPNQFCRTTDDEITCGEPVPEPSTIMGLLALGTLGAASTLKRKLKPSKSTEKEITKVS